MADILDTPGVCQLPLTRIKTIMKSSPDISNISQESLTLIAKATEIFLKDLAMKTHKRSKDPNNVDYKDLSELVDTEETYMFLTDIIPKKVRVSTLPKKVTGLSVAQSGQSSQMKSPKSTPSMTPDTSNSL